MMEDNQAVIPPQFRKKDTRFWRILAVVDTFILVFLVWLWFFINPNLVCHF